MAKKKKTRSLPASYFETREKMYIIRTESGSNTIANESTEQLSPSVAENLSPSTEDDLDAVTCSDLNIPALPCPSATCITVYSNIADLLVELRCDSEVYTFFVSTAALRLASPVWEKSLDPNGKFKSFDTRVVAGEIVRVAYLDDIEPSILNLFYRALHYKTNKMPKQIKLAELLGLALFADQFDCSKVLSPWVHSWIRSLATDPVCRVNNENFDSWLFISCCFADSEESQQVIRATSASLTRRAIGFRDGNAKIVLSSDDNDQLDGCSEESKNTDLIPDKILVHIMTTRESTIHLIFSMLQDFTTSIARLGMQTASERAEDALCKSQSCIDLAVGSFARSLYQNGFGYFPKVEMPFENQLAQNSIDTLCKKVLKLETSTFRFSVQLPFGFSLQGSHTDNIRSHESIIRNSKEACLQSSNICPISMALAKLQHDISTILEQVPGYEVPDLSNENDIKSIAQSMDASQSPAQGVQHLELDDKA